MRRGGLRMPSGLQLIAALPRIARIQFAHHFCSAWGEQDSRKTGLSQCSPTGGRLDMAACGCSPISSGHRFDSLPRATGAGSLKRGKRGV